MGLLLMARNQTEQRWKCTSIQMQIKEKTQSKTQ